MKNTNLLLPLLLLWDDMAADGPTKTGGPKLGVPQEQQKRDITRNVAFVHQPLLTSRPNHLLYITMPHSSPTLALQVLPHQISVVVVFCTHLWKSSNGERKKKYVNKKHLRIVPGYVIE